jgi:hypothetical protein
MQKIFQEYVGEAREEIKKNHPLAAQSIPLLAALSDAMGYQAWRATRAYDHIEVMFGVRMRDGSAGYSIDLHEAPVGAPGRITTIQLSSGELKELHDKLTKVLEGET